MFQTGISRSLRRQRVWEMRTDHCRRENLIEDHRTLCFLAQKQPSLYRGRHENNVQGREVSVIMRIFYTGTSGIILRSSLVICW